MSTIPFLEQNHDLSDCYGNRIQELSEYCSHEYYLSALPLVTNKERAVRGHSRILDAVKEFKRLLEITKCTPCRDDIANQIFLQEESLREIETVWKI